MNKSPIDSNSLTPAEKVDYLMNSLYNRDSNLLQDSKQECRLCGADIQDSHLYMVEKSGEYIPYCKEDALFILYLNMTKEYRHEEYNEFVKAIGREDLIVRPNQADQDANKPQSENGDIDFEDMSKIETIGLTLLFCVVISVLFPLYIIYKVLWLFALPIMAIWDFSTTTRKALENAAANAGEN